MKNYLLIPLLINLLGSGTSSSTDGNQPIGCDIHNLGDENSESFSTPIHFSDVISAMVKIPEYWKEFSIGFDSSSNDPIGTLTFTKNSNVSLTLETWDSTNIRDMKEIKHLPQDISSKLQPQKWIKISLKRNYGTLTVVIDNAEPLTFDKMDTSQFHYIYGYVKGGHYIDVGFNCRDESPLSTTAPRLYEESTQETKTGGSGAIVGVVFFIIILVGALVGGGFWYKKKKTETQTDPLEGFFEIVTCGRVKTNPLEGCLDVVTCMRVAPTVDSEGKEEQDPLMDKTSKSSEQKVRSSTITGNIFDSSDTGQDTSKNLKCQNNDKVSKEMFLCKSSSPDDETQNIYIEKSSIIENVSKLECNESASDTLATPTSSSADKKLEHDEMKIKQTSQNNDGTQPEDEMTVNNEINPGVQAGTSAFREAIGPDAQEEPKASDNPVETASSTLENDGQKKSEESVSDSVAPLTSGSDGIKAEHDDMKMKQTFQNNYDPQPEDQKTVSNEMYPIVQAQKTPLSEGIGLDTQDKTEAPDKPLETTSSTHEKDGQEKSDISISDTLIRLSSGIDDKRSEPEGMHVEQDKISIREGPSPHDVNKTEANDNSKEKSSSTPVEQDKLNSDKTVSDTEALLNSINGNLKLDSDKTLLEHVATHEDSLKENNEKDENVNESVNEEEKSQANQPQTVGEVLKDDLSLTDTDLDDSRETNDYIKSNQTGNDIKADIASVGENVPDEIPDTDAKEILNNTKENLTSCTGERVDKQEESFAGEKSPGEKFNKGQTTERHKKEDNYTKDDMNELENQIASAESSCKHADEKDNAEANVGTADEQQNERKMEQGTDQDSTTETIAKDKCGKSDGQHEVTEEIIIKEMISKSGENDTSQPDRIKKIEETNKDATNSNADTGDSQEKIREADTSNMKNISGDSSSVEKEYSYDHSENTGPEESSTKEET